MCLLFYERVLILRDLLFRDNFSGEYFEEPLMQITSRSSQKSRAKGLKMTRLTNEKHFANLLKGYSEAFVTGKFCDVKVVCQVGSYFTRPYR
jgi:hypothetical protein